MSVVPPIRAPIAGLVTALLSFTAQPASANPSEAPEAFVRRVYALYKTSDDSTGAERTRPAWSAFYTECLLDAFAEDQALLQEKEGVIDNDPICACQAWENLRVRGIALTRGKAGTVKAHVLIGNFVGAQRVVTFVDLTLLQTAAGWHVGDKNRASIMAALQTEISEMKRAARPGVVRPKPKP